MGFLDNLAGMFSPRTPNFNPNSPTSIYDPTDEERKKAFNMALMQAGVGILANNKGNYGQALPAIGAGLQQGLQGYQENLAAGPANRMKQMQQQLYGQQVESNLETARDKKAEREAKILEDKQDAETNKYFLKTVGLDPDNLPNDLVRFAGISANPVAQTSPVARPIQPQTDFAGSIKPLPELSTEPVGKLPDYSFSANDIEVNPAPPKTPLDELAKELGWSESIKKVFLSQAKANPKAASDHLMKQVDEYIKSTRKGSKAARDELAKEKAIAEAIGVPLGQYLKQKTEKSGVNVNVQNVIPGAKEAAASLAKPIGDRAESSLAMAEGASETMNNANRAREALNRGLVIAGPAAGVRLKWAQLKNLVGFGDTQQLEDTRSTIQSLAGLTLDSRASLKGQGQITEGETKLLERARSGNIEEMTVDELQTVVDISQRLAGRQWEKHQNLLGIMKDDPTAAASYKYYVPSVNLPGALTRPGQPKPKTVDQLPKKPGQPSVSNW